MPEQILQKVYKLIFKKGKKKAKVKKQQKKGTGKSDKAFLKTLTVKGNYRPKDLTRIKSCRFV